MPHDELVAAKEELQHWKAEVAAARSIGDKRRIARCERFIKQCEKIIAALERAKTKQ